MIQRIQSFWLVLAACCVALCFMTPIAEYHLTVPATGQQVEAELNLLAKSNPEMLDEVAQGAEVVTFSQPQAGLNMTLLIVMASLTIAIAVASIFFFKKRMLQVRVVLGAFLLNVIYDFVLLFWAVDAYGDKVAAYMQAGDLHISWFAGAYAPIVSIVFFILAIRAIRSDEAKVRAADRLR